MSNQSMAQYYSVLRCAKKGTIVNVPLGESVVVNITEYIKDIEYNICCDNFFTSSPKKWLKTATSKIFFGWYYTEESTYNTCLWNTQPGCVNSSNFFLAHEKWQNVCYSTNQKLKTSLSFVHHAFYARCARC